MRKNRVFSERIAKNAGLQTEKERLAEAMPTPAKKLFASEAEWQAALAARHITLPASGPKRREAHAIRRKRILKEYGFDIDKPVNRLTDAEREGFRRLQRDEEAVYRNRHHDQIMAYNREYRRRKRAEALAEKQKLWTPEEWTAWRAKEDARQRGEPAQFVKAVVHFLAQSGNLSEDDVMTHLLEHGGVEFLLTGATLVGKDRAKRPATVEAAARAVGFFIDPDTSLMFPE